MSRLKPDTSRPLDDRVEELIKFYIETHPLEIRVLVRENKKHIELAKNKDTMVTTGGSMKMLGGVPEQLMKQVQSVDPRIFKDKDRTRWFFKKFQLFATVKAKRI